LAWYGVEINPKGGVFMPMTEKQLRQRLLATGYGLHKIRGAELWRIKDNHSGKYSEALRASDIWSVAKYLI
jgi:hypothetical protein